MSCVKWEFSLCCEKWEFLPCAKQFRKYSCRKCELGQSENKCFRVVYLVCLTFYYFACFILKIDLSCMGSLRMLIFVYKIRFCFEYLSTISASQKNAGLQIVPFYFSKTMNVILLTRLSLCPKRFPVCADTYTYPIMRNNPLHSSRIVPVQFRNCATK